MNLRELLHYELWSKRTSWKILGGLGIVVFLCFLGSLGWNQIELHWLTSGERIAARTALTEIDSLQDSGTLNEQEWKARALDAKAKVKIAQAAAKTYRDHFAEMDLGWYFLEVEMDHGNLQRRAAGKRELQITPIVGKSTTDLRAALHKELD